MDFCKYLYSIVIISYFSGYLLNIRKIIRPDLVEKVAKIYFDLEIDTSIVDTFLGLSSSVPVRVSDPNFTFSTL